MLSCTLMKKYIYMCAGRVFNIGTVKGVPTVYVMTGEQIVRTIDRSIKLHIISMNNIYNDNNNENKVGICKINDWKRNVYAGKCSNDDSDAGGHI